MMTSPLSTVSVVDPAINLQIRVPVLIPGFSVVVSDDLRLWLRLLVTAYDD